MASLLDIGKRMKEYYELPFKYLVPRRTYTIIRVDGRSFHSLTRHLERPFSQAFMNWMDATCQGLVHQIQGCKFGYVQSDEISLLLTDFDELGSQPWMGGVLQKQCSLSAAMATMFFNAAKEDGVPVGLGCFDSRVYTLPCKSEVENYFYWRWMDCRRNAVQMAAQSKFSHQQLHQKNTAKMMDMLLDAGIDFNDYPRRFRFGALVDRNDVPEMLQFQMASYDKEAFREMVYKLTPENT